MSDRGTVGHGRTHEDASPYHRDDGPSLLRDGAARSTGMLGFDIGPTALLVLLMVVIFLLGWPLEWPAVIFIFLPNFSPW